MTKCNVYQICIIVCKDLKAAIKAVGADDTGCTEKRDFAEVLVKNSKRSTLTLTPTNNSNPNTNQQL